MTLASHDNGFGQGADFPFQLLDHASAKADRDWRPAMRSKRPDTINDSDKSLRNTTALTRLLARGGKWRATADKAERTSALDSDFDTLTPGWKVREGFGISEMTEHRWDQDERLEELGWPPPIWIRNRKYRSTRMLQAFVERMIKESIANRGKLPQQYARANAASQTAKKAKAAKSPTKHAA